MFEIKLSQEIEIIDENIHLWLPVEFARELVKKAMDSGVKSIEFINLEDPGTGEVVLYDSEIDQLLTCYVEIKE